jgi:hypothetical protein
MKKLANQFGHNQFTWRHKYKTEISSSIIFFTNRSFKQQKSKYTGQYGDFTLIKSIK